MYSAAMAPHLRPLDQRWRALLAYVLTDQAFARAIRRFRESDDLAGNASYFLGAGVLLWTVWQLATLLGILAGQIVPASWQLEFVVPLCFIAILMPLLRDRVSLLVFVATAIAAIMLDAMPLRLSMICAGLLGIAAGVVADARKGARG
jgi:predicted branched-subunit amino acid permease